MKRLFLLVALAVVAGVGYQYYRQQSQLELQLQQLDYALTSENSRQTEDAANMLQAIKAAVEKNHDAPADLRVLHRAASLSACVAALLDTIQADRARLRRATANPATPALLRHPGATGPVARLLGQGTRHQQALCHQAATCADTLRQIKAAYAVTLQLPDFDSKSVLDALTSLTQFESDLLTAEVGALRRLDQAVRTRQLFTRPLAVATAESNVVVPGGTYRAQLLLAENLVGLRLHMFCNGRPMPVSPDGVGMIRFRAPTRPGPATWTGTIRFNQNGLDDTFRVIVPYRVVRR